jgi:hypothetical protein
MSGSKGFVINSGNAGQMSVIESGGIQVEDIAIDIVVANMLQIRRVFGGGPMDTAFISLSVGIDVLVEGSSSEAWGAGRTWRTDRPCFLKVIPPAESYPMAETTLTLKQNQINNPIRVESSIRIVSLGDTWGYCEQFTPATAWASGVAYTAPAIVSVGTKNYSLLVNHTSGASFAVDLAAGRWQVYSIGAYGECTAGDSSIVAINNGINSIIVSPTTNLPTMGWRHGAYVKLSSLDPGRGWSTPLFNAAEFLGNGSMTWTVQSADVGTYAYTLDGRTMTLAFTLNGTSVGGTPSSILRMTIPAGKVATKAMNVMVRASDNGTPVTAWAYTDISGIYINVQKIDFSNWAASTNATTIQGQITFEVD